MDEKEYTEIINYVINHFEELDVKEKIITATAFVEMAEALKPIYENHVGKRFFL